MLGDRHTDQQYEQHHCHHRSAADRRRAERLGIDPVGHQVGAALRAAAGQCIDRVEDLVGACVSNVQGDEKTSHITQRSKGEAYAESQDWTVVRAFEDMDVSAIKLSAWERPDLKAWLTDRADDWDALIFAKTESPRRSTPPSSATPFPTAPRACCR